MPLILLTVALCALFLAQAATRLLAASVLESAARREDLGKAAAGARRPPEPRRYDPTPILRRNIFDSVQGDLTGMAEAEQDLDEDLVSAWDGSSALPRCENDLRLVGAVASSSDWAMAAIVGSTGQTSFHRRGSQVEDAIVLGIGADHVIVQPSGEDACRLEMFSYGDTERRPRVASAPRPKTKTAKDKDVRGPRVKRDRNAGLTADEISEGIQRISDSSFVIKRAILSKVLDNPGKLMDIGRIRPHQEGGKTVGMKLQRIRPNTLLTKLGLRNGDILVGIDGEDLSSPDTALQAYASLRTSESLNLTVRRKGSPVTIRYSIE